jgi:hypothetical protein
MDKHRTENMAGDDTEIYIKDVRSTRISEDDVIYKSEQDLKEGELNEQHRLTNMYSQKNAEHNAKYGDASDGAKSRFPQDLKPEDAHVPQG